MEIICVDTEGKICNLTFGHCWVFTSYKWPKIFTDAKVDNNDDDEIDNITVWGFLWLEKNDLKKIFLYFLPVCLVFD